MLIDVLDVLLMLVVLGCYGGLVPLLWLSIDGLLGV